MKKIIFIVYGCVALIFSSCKTATEPPLGQATYKTNIGIVNIDGTNIRYLTVGNQIVQYANFLPNGEKIVYVQNAYNGPETMYTMNPDGSNITPILTKGIFLQSIASPLSNLEITQRVRLTKDSKKILFSTPYEPEYSDDIFCVNVDGSNLVNLTKRTNYSIMYGSFALSNDDKMIVYTEHHKDSTNADYLCIRNIDGSNARILKKVISTRLQYPQFFPADNDIIVYFEGENFVSPTLSLKRISVSDTSNSATIGIIPRLFQYPYILGSNKMLFTSLTPPTAGLTTIDLSTGIIRSTPIDLPGHYVTVSNDETLLAWSNHIREFGIMQSDGTGMKTLSGLASGDYNLQPYVSPNNQQVIFLSSTLYRE